MHISDTVGFQSPQFHIVPFIPLLGLLVDVAEWPVESGHESTHLNLLRCDDAKVDPVRKGDVG